MVALCLVLSGCALHAEIATDTTVAAPIAGHASHCAAAPDAERGRFRRMRNRWAARLGEPRHRGIDLIALAGDENQTIGGKLAYTHAPYSSDPQSYPSVFAVLNAVWSMISGVPIVKILNTQMT